MSDIPCLGSITSVDNDDFEFRIGVHDLLPDKHLILIEVSHDGGTIRIVEHTKNIVNNTVIVPHDLSTHTGKVATIHLVIAGDMNVVSSYQYTIK